MNIWVKFILLTFILGVIYFLVNAFLIKKKKIKLLNSDKLINILIAIEIIVIIIITMNEYSVQGIINSLLASLDSLNALVLATTGIVLIFRTSITTNFAQGMMATFGAFTTARFVASFASMTLFKGNPTLMIVIAVIVGVIVSFLLGLIIDTLIIRKARFVTPVGKQMITMGLVLVISGLIPVVFGVIPMEIPRFATNLFLFELFGLKLRMTYHSIITTSITIGVLSVLFINLRYTKWGLGVRATASNEMVAGMMGINTRKITAFSWAVAGGLGGLAAVLYAPSLGPVTSTFMVSIQVNGFLSSILGGFSSYAGPIIGAILIPVLSSVFTYIDSQWASIIVYVVILLLVLIKPIGLFGKRIAKKV